MLSKSWVYSVGRLGSKCQSGDHQSLSILDCESFIFGQINGPCFSPVKAQWQNLRPKWPKMCVLCYESEKSQTRVEIPKQEWKTPIERR